MAPGIFNYTFKSVILKVQNRRRDWRCGNGGPWSSMGRRFRAVNPAADFTLLKSHF